MIRFSIICKVIFKFKNNFKLMKWMKISIKKANLEVKLIQKYKKD